MLEQPIVFPNEDDIPLETKVIDARRSALKELFGVRNPSFLQGAERDKAEQTFIAEHVNRSLFVYYPWIRTAVRIPGEAEYFELRTARNRNIITQQEQQQYREACVAIAGLSVGSAIVHSFAMTGGPKRMRLADPDIIEITNLNRLRATLLEVGESKVATAAKMTWLIDPFAELELFPSGVTEESIDDFTGGANVIIDEMESLEFKVGLRLTARAKRIPVLMATDNGNGIVLDVERFDLLPKAPLLHGMLPSEDPNELRTLSKREWLGIATRIVGVEHLDERMRTSLLSVGKTLAAVPQLGTSASLAGSAVSHVARLLLTGHDVPSGRYAFAWEDLFDQEYRSKERIEQRRAEGEAFLRALMHV